VAVLLIDRRASFFSWLALGVVALIAQVVIGQGFAEPVPPITLVVAPLLLVSICCAAAAVRRAGRVFAPQSDHAPRRSATREQVRI
jgi:hypothetical protein